MKRILSLIGLWCFVSVVPQLVWADCAEYSVNFNPSVFDTNGFMSGDALFQTANSASFLYESYQDYSDLINWRPPLLPKTSFNNRVWACGNNMKCDTGTVVLVPAGHAFQGNNIAVQQIYTCDAYKWIAHDIKGGCSEADIRNGVPVNNIENSNSRLYYEISGTYCIASEELINCIKAADAKEGAVWNGESCICEDNKDWNGQHCVASSSGGVASVQIVNNQPSSVSLFTCDANVLQQITSYTAQYADNASITTQINNILVYCSGDAPNQIVFNNMYNQLMALINQVNTDSANAALNARITVSRTNISNAIKSINDASATLDVSKWRNTEGNFNTSRLLSDSIAGVVLGTAGGLITSHVVKQGQIENGFEDLQCTVGGQVVANWNDQFRVGIQ